MPDFSSKRIYNLGNYGYLLGLYSADRKTGAIADVLMPMKPKTVLRHDVDHDLDTALRLAEWEANHGFRATYCLLHTSWYYGEFTKSGYKHSKRLVEAISTIADLGHEINFHNNLITLALEQGGDPGNILKQELEYFRSSGIEITGTSTHGDAACHKYGYRNFHIFSEIAEKSPPDLTSDCPPEIRKLIGSVSMTDCGLEYEAYGIIANEYISDSGGKLRSHLDAPGWGRTCVDNLRKIGRCVDTYILTHPVWWHI